MDLVPIIIVPTIVYFFYKSLESLIRRKERMMIVEKLDFSIQQALPSAEAFNVLDSITNKRFSSLRTGSCLAGIGLGLIVAWVVVATVYPITPEQYTENHFVRGYFRDYLEQFKIIYLAAPALFGGIGLIISYIIEQKVHKQEK